MMYQPRLSQIVPEKSAAVLKLRKDMLAKTQGKIRAEPEKLSETRHSLVASDHFGIAAYSYALGYPFSEIRLSLTNSVSALDVMFGLRGTSTGIPVEVLTYDPEKAPGEPGSYQIAPLNPPDHIDYSLTNSFKNYLAVCKALIVGDFPQAEKFAGLIWDPPQASYVGVNSEVCTPNQQHLAYAVKALFAGDETGMARELSRIKPGKRDQSLTDQATMLRAIVARDADSFVKALQSLLQWNKLQARRSNPDWANHFLCIPGLGLSRLAVQRGVCTWDELPQDDVYLPLDLIRS